MSVSRIAIAIAAPLALLLGSASGCRSAPQQGTPDRDGATTLADATANEASVAATDGSARDASPADPVATAARGKLLYGKYCGFCHGESGEGYKADQAPALASDDLLALASDEFLRDAIVKGRPGTTMSAWSTARGGPLGYGDADAIVAYLRTWQKRPSAPPEERTAVGTASAGVASYATHCASCHGPKGRDGKYNAISNAELLGSASDGFLATTIERGRAGTPMKGFADKLPKGAVDDIIALLRSWKRAPEEAPDLPPKPGALAQVVLNPKGPQPALDAEAPFVAVDAVKRELDRNATMILIDARPPADYARMHIAGAISVPFYQVADYAKQLPKDRYILTYCACPHAESGQVRDALKKLDYPRVAVIDEGLLVWRDRGYPVRGGAKP